MSINLENVSSGYSTEVINDNFQRIEDHINQYLLWRDGAAPGQANQMEAALDMNSNKIMNVGTPANENDVARLKDVQNAIGNQATANLTSFSPYGSIAATNVQGAIEEIEDNVGDLTVVSGTGEETLTQALDNRARYETADVSIRVPTDFPTLQEAIDEYSTRIIKQGVTIELLIEAGHVPSSGVSVENGDYGHFIISSADPVVNTLSPFSGGGFIEANNARAPTLNTLVDFGGAGAFNGVWLNNNSTGIVNPGCGVRNGYGRGLQAENGSTAVADSAVFTGFQQAGVHASRASTIQCSYAVLTDNSLDPSNTFGAIYASRASRIHGADIDARSSGGDGVRAQRTAEVSVPGIKLDGATKIAMVAVSSAQIYTGNGVPSLKNLKGRALVAQQGAKIDIDGTAITMTASSSGNAIEASNGAALSASNLSLSGHTGNGVFVSGSRASIPSCTITGGTNGIFAQGASTVDASSCNISSVSANGVLAQRASSVSVVSGSVTGSGGNDLSVTTGGMIAATGCSTSSSSGSPSVSDTNLTSGLNFADNGNRGFIWA